MAPRKTTKSKSKSKSKSSAVQATACNCKRFFISVIIIFAVVAAGDWGSLIYFKDEFFTADAIWRSFEEIKANYHYLLLAELVFAIGFVWIYTKIYRQGSLKEGLTYGLMISVIFVSMCLGYYVALPIEGGLLGIGIIGSVVSGLILGAIVSFTYKA